MHKFILELRGMLTGTPAGTPELRLELQDSSWNSGTPAGTPELRLELRQSGTPAGTPELRLPTNARNCSKCEMPPALTSH